MSIRSIRRVAFAVAAAVFALALAVPAAAGGPAIVWQEVSDPDAPRLEAGEGHVWLRWTTDGADSVKGFELERSSPGLEPLKRSFSKPATFVTGLPEGVTEIRVRALGEGGNGPWSVPLRVTVEYPARSLVRYLSLLGTALFLATAGLIYFGHRRYALQHKEASRD